jgi:hypothetical protein
MPGLRSGCSAIAVAAFFVLLKRESNAADDAAFGDMLFPCQFFIDGDNFRNFTERVKKNVFMDRIYE